MEGRKTPTWPNGSKKKGASVFLVCFTCCIDVIHVDSVA